MKLYGFDHSRSHRVVWALEEVGEPYEYQRLDFTKGDHKAPEFLAKNPGGKVPVIEDGDLMLAESAAIVTYIGDKYPQKNLVPRPGTHERALYGQWIAFVIGEMEQPLWTMGRHKFIYPEEKRTPQILDIVPWEFAAQIKVLEQGLADKSYILGEQFTMADILIGHTLFWARKFEMPIPSAKVEEYADRLAERDGFKRANARYEKS